MIQKSLIIALSNMKKNLWLLLTGFVISLTSHAVNIEPNLKWGKPTHEELTMTEYEPDKDADAVELCREVDVFYEFVNGNFRVSNVVKCRLKVLKPEGRHVANISIITEGSEEYPLMREWVHGLKATAFNIEDGKEVKTKMEKSMVYEEQLNKTDKLIKFSVPQVRVGTVIEYEYTLESDFFYMLRDWYAQSDIPVLYTKYSISIPEWFRFHTEETGMNNLETIRETNHLTIGSEVIITNDQTYIGRELPALKDDDYVWHANDYGSKVTHEIQGIYIPGVLPRNYTSKWEDIDKILFLSDDFGRRIRNSSPLKDEIITAGIPQIENSQKRVEATWKLLRQRVRWNGEYAFGAKSGSKTLKEGTGTNADINFLLINMLHDANIKAFPIALRLRDRGRLPISHASLKYFSTFVVGIQLNDSTTTYFDSSAEDGYLNVLPTCLSVTQARPIGQEISGEWIDLQSVAQSTANIIIQATLDTDGMITGTMSSIFTGDAAVKIRKKWRTGKDSVDVVHQIQDAMDFEIANYQIQGRNDFTPDVHEKISFSKQCTKNGDIIYLNPLVVMPFSKNPFISETRNLPVELPCKQRETINVVLTLPDGWQAEEMSKPVMLKYDGITARIMSNQSGNQLSVRYRLDIQSTFFSQQQYSGLRSFFEKLLGSCKNIITLKKMNH